MRRADAARHAEWSTGTGLGLSTAHAVAQQHEGHLAVRSAAGAGTTVTLYLPRVREEVAEVAPARRRAVSTAPLRVLVVEDDDDVRRAVVERLRKAGHDVEAVDGAEAARGVFDQRGRGRFDLVVSDVLMPGERGDSLARHLIVVDPEVRILLVSGYDAGRGVERLTDPRVAFLPKPFTDHVLAEAIRDLLAAARSGGSGAPGPATESPVTRAS